MSRRLCAASILLLLPSARSPAQNERPPDQRMAPILLIVHGPALESAALEWAAFRHFTGWRSHVHAVPPGATAPSIRELIRAAVPARRGTMAVLLLGDADAIPPWRFPQRDPQLIDLRDDHFASDHPYQLIDDADDIADYALGRVPARSDEEAMIALRKTRAVEERAARRGPPRPAITCVAGEARFGAVDRMLETLFKGMVDRCVPDAFDVSMTYANPTSIYCPPPSRLRSTVLARLNHDAVLFNYLGHGGPTAFDALHWHGGQVPILRNADLADLPPDGNPVPLALLLCCSTGWFDLPRGERSLAEALLFQPAGPAAIIAGSRPTHPYANAVIQKDVMRLLLVDGAPTAGDLDLRASRTLTTLDEDDRELDQLAAPMALAMRWATTPGDLRRMHTRLYNLLGDPALHLPDLPGRISDLALDGARLHGRIDAMAAGEVDITIETARAVPARQQDLVPVDGALDPDLERKAAANYPAANDHVLWRAAAKVVAGEFLADLPSPLPSGAACIKARARGRTDAGAPLSAAGALRLPPND